VDAPRGSINQGGTARNPRPCRARVFLWPRPTMGLLVARHGAVPRELRAGRIKPGGTASGPRPEQARAILR